MSEQRADWTWGAIWDELRMGLAYRLLALAIRLCPMTREGTRVVLSIERIARREIQIAAREGR
jgi:hypothetical protein